MSRSTSLFESLPNDLIVYLYSQFLKTEDAVALAQVSRRYHALIKKSDRLQNMIRNLKITRSVHVCATPSKTFVWRNYSDHCVIAAAGVEANEHTSKHGFNQIDLPEDITNIKQVEASDYSVFINGVNSSGNPVVLFGGHINIDAFDHTRDLTISDFIKVDIPKNFKSISTLFFSNIQFIIIFGMDELGNPLMAALHPKNFGTKRLNFAVNESELLNLPPDIRSIDNITNSDESFSSTLLFHAKDIEGKSLLYSLSAKQDGFEFTQISLPENMKCITHFCYDNTRSIVCGLDQEKHPILAVFGDNLSEFGVTKKGLELVIIKLPSNLVNIKFIHSSGLDIYLCGMNTEGKVCMYTTDDNRHPDPANMKMDTPFAQVNIPSEFTSVTDFVSVNSMSAFIVGEDNNHRPLLAAIGSNYHSELGLPYQTNMKSRFFSKVTGVYPNEYLRDFTLIPLPEEIGCILHVHAERHSVLSGLRIDGMPIVLGCGENSNGQLGVLKHATHDSKKSAGSLFRQLNLPDCFLINKESIQKSRCVMQ